MFNIHFCGYERESVWLPGKGDRVVMAVTVPDFGCRWIRAIPLNSYFQRRDFFIPSFLLLLFVSKLQILRFFLLFSWCIFFMKAKQNEK